MKISVAGIIAEYNPFHKGHLCLIEEVKKAGATHIAAVMSGNFIQRGGPAMISKFVRAQAAVASGADLVLELPLPFAMSTAQTFARAGIFLLGALGCVERLAFGSESGDIAALEQAARILGTPECSAKIKEHLKKGIPYAAARQEAFALLAGEPAASLLSGPNNTLGIEYLAALHDFKIPMKAFSMKRHGTGHDSMVAREGTASGSLLRKLLLEKGINSLLPYVPEKAFQWYREGAGKNLPCMEKRLELAVLSSLRQMERDAFARLPDISEGLDARIYNSVRQAASLEGLLASVKTKRYPMSRIRRILWSAFLGIPAGLSKKTPPYLRILAMNCRGREILAHASPSLPLSSSLRDLERLGGDCAVFSRLEARAGDLYALGLPEPLPCGTDYTHRVCPLNIPPAVQGRGKQEGTQHYA